MFLFNFNVFHTTKKFHKIKNSEKLDIPELKDFLEHALKSENHKYENMYKNKEMQRKSFGNHFPNTQAHTLCHEQFTY